MLQSACLLVIWDLLSLGQFDHINRMITLSVITLSGLHCSRIRFFTTVICQEKMNIIANQFTENCSKYKFKLSFYFLSGWHLWRCHVHRLLRRVRQLPDGRRNQSQRRSQLSGTIDIRFHQTFHQKHFFLNLIFLLCTKTSYLQKRSLKGCQIYNEQDFTLSFLCAIFLI